MKLDIKSVVIIILAIYVGYNFFFTETEPIKDVSVIIPEKAGKVEKKIDSIIRDTIYIDVLIPGKKEIVVDSLYKAQYEDAIKSNDSLKAKNLFLESISLDNWEGTLVNNKEVMISGKFLTRGKLLEYNIDYKIKSDTLTYTPEVAVRYPKLSFVIGADVILPAANPYSPYITSPMFQARAGFQNKKGHTFTVIYNDRGAWGVGYSKSFKLSKR